MTTPISSGQPAGSALPAATEIDVRVGKRIRERREAVSVTQSGLARQLGVTFSQVQKYEKGSNRIGAGRLYLVAAYLGVPVAFFFDGLDASAQAAHAAAPEPTSAEMAMLRDAFGSIRDLETRNSVLALVRSLAASADFAGGPRRIVA